MGREDGLLPAVEAVKRGEKPIAFYQALGQKGGRPRLGMKASVGVYQSADGTCLLSIRIGEDLCKKLGWRKGTRLVCTLTAEKRIINLRPSAGGSPLLRKTGAKSLLFQQTVTRVLEKMPTVTLDPLVLGFQLTLRLDYKAPLLVD
jgi:hypothetical protein